MNYCFIGNSQITAIKLGWDVVKPSYDGVSIDFFGAQGTDLRSLRRSGSKLASKDPKVIEQFAFTSGKPVIDVMEYDGFSLFSGVSMLSSLRILQNHLPMSVAKQRNVHLVSEEFASEAVYDNLKRGLTMRTARLVRAITSRPIVVCPAPMPSELIPREGVYALDEGVNLLAKQLWREALIRLSDEVGFTVAEQPEETLSGLFTKSQYSRGSIRLLDGFNTPHTETDHVHMNADFGGAMLPRILPALAA